MSSARIASTARRAPRTKWIACSSLAKVSAVSRAFCVTASRWAAICCRRAAGQSLIRDRARPRHTPADISNSAMRSACLRLSLVACVWLSHLPIHRPMAAPIPVAGSMRAALQMRRGSLPHRAGISMPTHAASQPSEAA